MTAGELLNRRSEIRAELESGTRHVLGILRDPEPVLQSAPVGDVLCWADGLSEAAVARILILADVKWGKRLASLTQRQVTALCFQIKTRHPETWDSWREALAA